MNKCPSPASTAKVPYESAVGVFFYTNLSKKLSPISPFSTLKF